MPGCSGAGPSRSSSHRGDLSPFAAFSLALDLAEADIAARTTPDWQAAVDPLRSRGTGQFTAEQVVRVRLRAQALGHPDLRSPGPGAGRAEPGVDANGSACAGRQNWPWTRVSCWPCACPARRSRCWTWPRTGSTRLVIRPAPCSRRSRPRSHDSAPGWPSRPTRSSFSTAPMRGWPARPRARCRPGPTSPGSVGSVGSCSRGGWSRQWADGCPGSPPAWRGGPALTARPVGPVVTPRSETCWKPAWDRCLPS